MIKLSHRKALMTVAAGSLLWSTQAYGQATRTYVSGVGDDFNPCSRSAPCKTFAGAITRTAPGGEINCLDPAGYGNLVITRPISVICQYTGAGIMATHGSTAILVNVTATDHVYLSGLDLNGGNGPNPGLHGVRIVGGGFIHIENSLIRNFRAAGGNGISVLPASTAQVTVTDTTIADNGSAGSGNGILIQPTGAGGIARVILRDVRVQNNANHQLRVDTTGNTGAGISLFVEGSQLFGGVNGISINQAPSTTSVTTVVQDSFLALGSGTGIVTAGAGTNRVRVGNTTITGWATGLTQGGTTIINTYGTNRFDGNGAVGTFTTPAIGQQ